MMSMKVVRQLDYPTWRGAIDRHPQGNIFHTPEMFEIFARTKGYQPQLWAVVDGDEVLALMMPVQITLMSGLARFFTTRSVVHGGLFWPGEQVHQQALMLLLRTYTSEAKGALFTELRHQTDSSALQPILAAERFTLEEHCNYLVNLALSTGQIWEKISKSTRKKIARVQQNQQLIVEELQHKELLPVWYSLIQKTFRTVRVPLADYSLFDAAFDLLQPHGMIQFLLGRAGEQYVAASAALLYKETIYGWYRGFDRDFGYLLPNDVMVWRLLKWGAEHGYRQFDFGGAGKPGEPYGPREFKAKFGGELVVYNRNTYVHAPIRLKLAKTLYYLKQKGLPLKRGVGR
jgi:CelD/BcsL family acetyltransferase involved in cellulose biosynthesis